MIIAGNESLRAHMYKQHQISRMFMCRCCNWAFPDKTSLHLHMQTTGGIGVASKAPKCSSASRNSNPAADDSPTNQPNSTAISHMTSFPLLDANKNGMQTNIKQLRFKPLLMLRSINFMIIVVIPHFSLIICNHFCKANHLQTGFYSLTYLCLLKITFKEERYCLLNGFCAIS